MKKVVFAILLVSSPAWAQAKQTPKSAAARVDDCAPIGRTAKGELVYSMKCESPPTPPTPEVQAEPAPAAPEPPADSGGLLGKFPFGNFGATPEGTKPAMAGPAGH
jgi:hypothetical protein